MGAQSGERTHHLSRRPCRPHPDGLAQARELLCHRPQLSRPKQDLEVLPPHCHCPPSCGLFCKEHRYGKYQYQQALRKLRRAPSWGLQRRASSPTSFRPLAATTSQPTTEQAFCLLEPCDNQSTGEALQQLRCTPPHPTFKKARDKPCLAAIDHQHSSLPPRAFLILWG